MSGGGFDELGRELRDRVGDEFRAEAEAAEHDAAVARDRARTLVDVARAARDRSETITVSVAARRLTGAVGYAGDGRLALVGPAGIVDVVVAAIATLRVDPPARPVEVPATARVAGSMRSRLLALELQQRPVEVLLDDGSAVTGAIAGVRADHVLVRGSGSRTAVALGALVAVVDRSG